MTSRWSGFILLLAVLALLANGCSLESFRKHAAKAGGNPDEVSYAPSLGVRLSEMRESGDGLYVQDLTLGQGPAAVTGDRVSVQYTGWLPDGRKFDSTGEGGTPFAFSLGAGEVIRGWDEGVLGMSVGGVRRLVIPPSLGYGEQGSGPIPPNSTLVFEVKVVGITPPTPPAPAGQ